MSRCWSPSILASLSSISTCRSVGWDSIYWQEGIAVQTDDCGRPAISRNVFRNMAGAEQPAKASAEPRR